MLRGTETDQGGTTGDLRPRGTSATAIAAARRAASQSGLPQPSGGLRMQRTNASAGEAVTTAGNVTTAVANPRGPSEKLSRSSLPT